MSIAEKPVVESVTLPPDVAAQVRSLARARNLSSDRVLLSLIQRGLGAEKEGVEEQKEVALASLTGRLRNAGDAAEIERLGDELGRMIFGNRCRS